MTCREFIEFLMDYFAEELPGEQRRTFEEHMSFCAACVTYLNTYEETIKLGKGACRDPDDDVPADVPEQLVKAILEARKKGG